MHFPEEVCEAWVVAAATGANAMSTQAYWLATCSRSYILSPAVSNSFPCTACFLPSIYNQTSDTRAISRLNLIKRLAAGGASDVNDDTCGLEVHTYTVLCLTPFSSDMRCMEVSSVELEIGRDVSARRAER